LPDVSRIVVTGSESTGKTTLAKQLATRLRATWVPEYARFYATHVGRPLTIDDVEPVARGQMALEDAALASGSALLVLDTDLVSTVVYARHYYGHCPDWIVAAARERLAHLYLLLDVDVEWIGDGVRDQPGARLDLHRRFQEQLRDLGARMAGIHGLGDARLVHALAAVERFRAQGA
jgi:NadR type nicotinamide-nucleotide adenylyltransferase